MEGKKSFSEFVRDYQGGELNEELTEALNSLVGAVQVCQREGKVSVEIQVKPNNGHESFMVQARVKVKEPQPNRPSAIYYADERLNLVREDPRQMKFTDIEKTETQTA